MLIEQENKERNKLDEKTLARIDEFIDTIDDNSDYFSLLDGQSKRITFDLENSTGFQKRTLYLDDGTKTINKFVFIVILQSGKKQIWELSPRFSKQACRAMKLFGTTNLVVKRIGDGFDTKYFFVAPEHIQKYGG